MLLLKIIIFILNIPTFLFGAHFVIFGLFPYFKKKKEFKEVKACHHFLIIIPARNEETVIPELIESLNNQNYPKDMYQIYVVPNNCQDKTKEVANASGAKVLDINQKVKTKGEVLNYVFKKMKNRKDFDTYVIFDADNVVHPDFLKEINNVLESGYQAVQGCRDTKNLYATWLSNSYALSYYLQNIFIYEPRIRIGESANLNGTGYAINKEIIEKIKYQASTLTEDIELMNVLLMILKLVMPVKPSFMMNKLKSFLLQLNKDIDG